MLILGNTEGWKLYGRLTNGNFLFADPTDRVYFSGANFGDVILSAQDSTHLATSGGAHRCTTTHLHNTKYLSGSTVSINGAGSTSLPVASSQCPLLFVLFSLEEIVIEGGSFYIYSTGDNPVANVTFYAAEGGVSSTWKEINGYNNRLTLSSRSTPATDHDFNMACSYMPSTGSGVTGNIKIRASYV